MFISWWKYKIEDNPNREVAVYRIFCFLRQESTLRILRISDRESDILRCQDRYRTHTLKTAAIR